MTKKHQCDENLQDLLGHLFAKGLWETVLAAGQPQGRAIQDLLESVS